MNFPKKDIKYYDTDSSNNSTNNYTNNIVQTNYLQRNQTFNNLSNFELRKIIKEEFESYIKPYKIEILRLKGDINNKLSNNYFDNNLNFNSFPFVDKEVFNQRMKKIESEMDFRLNNLKASQNKINNIIKKDVNKIQFELNNIKNDNSNKKSLELNKEENSSFADINKLNEILGNLKEDMNSFKTELISSLFEKNKISGKFDFKAEDLKNDSNSNNYNLSINKIKEDMKKINGEILIIKNENENLETKIYQILEKLNLTKLSNFKLDKFYTIQKSCSILMDNYLDITNMINNLNNKMEHELNKISDQININFNSIENHNLRINELAKEFSEEKSVNLENILQNKNNIKTNRKKLMELEEKNKISDQIIIKLDEEKLKKLENRIKKIEKELAYNIEEGKKSSEINNEIYMNSKRNIDEKFQEINQEIINIKKEIEDIKKSNIFNIID